VRHKQRHVDEPRICEPVRVVGAELFPGAVLDLQPHPLDVPAPVPPGRAGPSAAKRGSPPLDLTAAIPHPEWVPPCLPDPWVLERLTFTRHVDNVGIHLPAEGIGRRSYLEQKFGGPERAAQIYERVRAAGRGAGLALDFDRIEKQPNTLDAHRLIAWAQAHEGRDAEPLVEALFRAYFVEGRFIGDRAELARIAGEAGFDEAAARAMLDSDEGMTQIADADRRARELGISGVPFFVFDGRVGVSGAAGPDERPSLRLPEPVIGTQPNSFIEFSIEAGILLS
jgi:predicted DsbA family dithiol-disulfide isomerase